MRQPMNRAERVERALNRSLDRYDRRGWGYARRDAMAPVWHSRNTTAMRLVKEARDLAGTLEDLLYDEVGS